MKRDYTRGALPAEDYNSFKVDLEQELAGAVGELDVSAPRNAELDPSYLFETLESDVLRKLSEIRAAIVGEVQHSSGVEAVRAALLRLFERFVSTWTPRPTAAASRP